MPMCLVIDCVVAQAKGSKPQRSVSSPAPSSSISTPRASPSATPPSPPAPPAPSPPTVAPHSADQAGHENAESQGTGFAGFITALVKSVKARLVTVKPSHVAQFAATTGGSIKALPAALRPFASGVVSYGGNITCTCGACPQGTLEGFERHVLRKHGKEYAEHCVDVAITAFAAAHCDDSLEALAEKFQSTCECITQEWCTMIARLQSEHDLHLRLQPTDGRIALYERAKALGVVDDLKCFFELFDSALDNYIKSRTSDHGKFGQRYNSVVKAVFLVTLNRGGASLFHFWESILNGPTVRTMQKLVSQQCAELGFSDVMARDALKFFKDYGYDPSTMPTHIAFDAAKVQGRWSLLGDNCVIGGDYLSGNWKVPFGSTVQFNDVMHSQPAAEYAYVFLICAACPSAPTVFRVVGVLPSTLKFNAEHVAGWLTDLRGKLQASGFNHIVSYGADGDGRHRKTATAFMQKEEAYGFVQEDGASDLGKGIRPILSLFAKKLRGSACFTMITSDPTHWVKKWSLCFFAMSRTMLLGPHPVLLTGLAMVHAMFKDAGLCARDVNGADKMDYPSAKRRINFSVRQHLADIPAHKGLCAFLAIGDCVDTAFFDKNIDMSTRWALMCRAAAFLRYWHSWHKLSKLSGMHFIPLQLFTDFFLMFHCFAFKVILHRDVYTTVPYAPWLDGSDQCECMFSILREMLPSFCLKRLLDLIKHHHAEMSVRSDPIVRSVLPPYVTKRGHNKSIYEQPTSSSVHSTNIAYPSDEAMLNLYSEQVEKFVKPLLVQLGMAELLKAGNAWDTAHLESFKEVQAALLGDEDDLDADAEELPVDHGVGLHMDSGSDTDV
jgi:hypothetical protein